MTGTPRVHRQPSAEQPGQEHVPESESGHSAGSHVKRSAQADAPELQQASYKAKRMACHRAARPAGGPAATVSPAARSNAGAPLDAPHERERQRRPIDGTWPPGTSQKWKDSPPCLTRTLELEPKWLRMTRPAGRGNRDGACADQKQQQPASYHALSSEKLRKRYFQSACGQGARNVDFQPARGLGS